MFRYLCKRLVRCRATLSVNFELSIEYFPSAHTSGAALHVARAWSELLVLRIGTHTRLIRRWSSMPPMCFMWRMSGFERARPPASSKNVTRNLKCTLATNEMAWWYTVLNYNQSTKRTGAIVWARTTSSKANIKFIEPRAPHLKDWAIPCNGAL